jgi:hypothetical protein
MHWASLRGRVSLCVLFGALLGGGRVGALTLDAFPLFHLERDRPSGRSVTELLWPLVEWRSADGHTLRAVRPLFAWESDAQEGWRELDVVWPFLFWGHTHIGDPEHERKHLRILPVLDWNRHTSNDLAPWRLTLFPLVYAGRTGPMPGQRYLIVFPLWWQAHDTRVFFPIYWSSPRSFSALFPLCGHFKDLWGRDDVRFVLFPLWSRSHRGEAVTDSVLWPFFAWTRGGPFHGLRAWPLFGYSAEEDKWSEGFFLWPLGHFRHGTRRDGKPNNLFFFLPYRFKWEIGDTRLNVRWPFWGTYRTPGHDTWSIAWPLHMHTVNRRHSYVEDRILWIIFRWRRGETDRALELLPIAGRREQPDRTVHYLLFPIYTHVERRWEDRTRDVRLLLPLYIHSLSRFASGEDWSHAQEREVKWIFPLYLHRRERDGSERTDWLWPLFITRSRGFEQSWAMLFRLWERGRHADGTRYLRVFGRLYRRETTADGHVTSDYNGLSLRRTRDGQTSRLSLFGPLLLRTSGVDGVRWSWFTSAEGSSSP